MRNLIILAGPAGTGKSTIINKLFGRYDATYYRPCDVYINNAKEKDIPISQAFEVLSDYEAGTMYSKICSDNDLIICDQHLAIQYEKDSKLASAIVDNSNDDEEYSESLNKEFMSGLLSNDVNILVICLYANKECLYNRMINRNNVEGQLIRNNSIDKCERELVAELGFYSKLISEYNLAGKMIDTSDLSMEEVLDYVIQSIDEFRGKGKSSSKWTK